MKIHNGSIIFIIAIMIINLLSCNVSENDQSSNNDDSQVKESSTNIDISDIPMLSIDAELPDSYPDKATIYEVSYYEPDGQLILETLMENKVNQEADLAEGKTYYYYGESGNLEESLTIYNTDIKKGGFQYLKPDELYAIKNEITKAYDVPSYIGSLMANEKLYPYSNHDLSFQNKTEVLNEIRKKMEAFHFPEISLRRIFSRDAKTMNENLKIVNEIYTAFYSGFEPFEVTFTENDEDYLIWYQQEKDGIPFINTIYSMNEFGVQPTHTIIQAIWSAKDGLRSMNCENMYRIGNQKSESDICSPEEAIRVFAEEYNKSLHFEDTLITGVELVYAVLYGKDGQLYAKPIWIISTKVIKKNENDLEYPEYAITAIDPDKKTILRTYYLDED